MEQAKPTEDARPRPAKIADEATPEKVKRRRPPSPRDLLRAKKKVDEAIGLLSAHTDLRAEATELRGKVFQRFIEEEENPTP